MSAIGQVRRTSTAGPGAWERSAWEHPEWWTLALSALAWLAIVSRAMLPDGGEATAGHSSHQAMVAVGPSAVASVLASGAFAWLLMVAAMMFPLVADAVRTTAARSLWARRHRAIGMFLIGYVAPWLIAGSAILVLAVLAASLRPSLSWLWVAAAFAGAAIWQLTPVKMRALRACHRTMPLAPRGWRADRDCVRYGWTIGGRCVVSCWAMMLACVLAGHSLPAMLCVSAVAAAERNVLRADRRVTAAVLVACGLAAMSF